MRALALDIGEVRVGLAVGSTQTGLAFPVCVLNTQDVCMMRSVFRRVLDDNEPDLLVCGLPLTLHGEEGVQVKRIRACALQIADCACLPVEFCDERYSSREAKRILREQGYDEKRMRGKIDVVAASLFLQTWLAQRADV